jgi:4-hydroxymandelate oxidase
MSEPTLAEAEGRVKRPGEAQMLALGAEGVLLGRDVALAAVGGGPSGVKLQMEFLQKVLASAMKMTGCATLDDITREILE